MLDNVGFPNQRRKKLKTFYVVKSKQNEPGKNAQDSLVFSKLRYCVYATEKSRNEKLKLSQIKGI